MYFGDDGWIIPYHDGKGQDVRGKLKELGFDVDPHPLDDLFCEVQPPQGWVKKSVQQLRDTSKLSLDLLEIPADTIVRFLCDAAGNPRIKACDYSAEDDDIGELDRGWLVFIE